MSRVTEAARVMARQIEGFQPAGVGQARAAVAVMMDRLLLREPSERRQAAATLAESAPAAVWASASAALTCRPGPGPLGGAAYSAKLAAVSHSRVSHFNEAQLAKGTQGLAEHYALRWVLSRNLRPDMNEFDFLDFCSLGTRPIPAPSGDLKPELAHALELSFAHPWGEADRTRRDAFCARIEQEIAKLCGEKVVVKVHEVLDGNLEATGLQVLDIRRPSEIL